jgi:hypothetical protein
MNSLKGVEVLVRAFQKVVGDNVKLVVCCKS